MLASGDKLLSDHTSKARVRGQCDNSPTGNGAAEATGEVISNACTQEIRLYILFQANSSKRRAEKKIIYTACCVSASVCVSDLFGVHRLFPPRAAVTVSRVEQMSPLKAFFSYTHHMGYITIMKSNLKPVPFAAIMTELFWAAEHEQSVFNIACSNHSAQRSRRKESGHMQNYIYRYIPSCLMWILRKPL